jgi:predicted DNA-binding transcriptional regulator AlpA
MDANYNLNNFEEKTSFIHLIPEHRITPRLLRRADAAYYVGVGVTLFDTLVTSGLLPSPKAIGKKRVAWDMRELDRAIDELPEAPSQADTQTTDPYLDVHS